MAQIRPFKALRPAPDLAKYVASVPYDVVNTEEARELATGNPHSFLRVIRSEIDLAPGADSHSEEAYAKAKENLQSLAEEGVLEIEEKPSLYIYRISAEGHSQTGVMCVSSVEDYQNGIVKTHEKTRPEKVEDRTKLMDTLGAQTGPVFLTCRNTDKLSSLISEATKSDALFDFEAKDGVSHTVWRVSETNPICEAFEEIPCTYVADGHHRAESANRYKEIKECSGEDLGNFFLTVIIPDNEVAILAYNRAVKKLPEGGTDSIFNTLNEVFSVSKTDNPVPSEKGTFCMYLDGQWYVLSGGPTSEDPVESLDASVLQNKVLEPVFGIDDPRTNPNIDFIGGIRGTAELEKLVDSGKAACAFSLYPVQIEELLAVADNGKLMPPKSTWFEPKLRSGLATYLLK